MASKTGILSDKASAVNCKEYSALPVGFANSRYIGAATNPGLPGIKTPKYMRSVAKPQSLDILAVNLSKNFGGASKAMIAREILEQYATEIKVWKPPKVEVMCPQYKYAASQTEVPYGQAEGAYAEREDFRERRQPGQSPYSIPEGQVVSILPRSTGLSRGDQILNQSISANQAVTASQSMAGYKVALMESNREFQLVKSTKIFNAFWENMPSGKLGNPGTYFEGAPDLTSDTKWRTYVSRKGIRTDATLELIAKGLAGSFGNFDVNLMLGIQVGEPVVMPKDLKSSGAGSSDDPYMESNETMPVRAAATGQGVTKAPEAATTPEVERK